MTSRPAVCLDVGSGWVKALGIDSGGQPSGIAQQATTPSDLLEGVHAAASAVGLAGPLTPRRPAGEDSGAELLACSSAGGGLRLAVVGLDRLASTEAGYQVACSSGARLVHVQAGLLEPSGVRALRAARPDVVLLVDGVGAAAPQSLLRNAARLARARVRAPIVLSVHESVRADALALLRATARNVVTAEPALPATGRVSPGSARAAVATLLGGHLVGGRGSATTARFRRLARYTTPRAVGRGLVELVRVRDAPGGAVLAVDVGSSTTDVYSALPGDPPELARSTSEADLGMRRSAEGILTDGQAAGLIDPVEADLLTPAVRRLAEETGYLPTDSGGRAEDRRLAALAAVLAVRRHLRVERERLAEVGVGLVVLTGGVFRQPDPNELASIRVTLRSDSELRELLEDCPVATDDGFALAPAGLLAERGRLEAAHTVLDAAIAPDN
ncbi:hypothetical protein GCM10023321_16860 [Pseudonocardia eucalypti]|uniref:Glutamate mutase n=1 Tax=Pseudonocardia eucalypti TaxID=648755 RepID=A0ABP9PRM4_9PSEU|nr:uncharacterized protein (TIGR01319 family) [Pseudonocardia eucalypti]